IDHKFEFGRLDEGAVRDRAHARQGECFRRDGARRGAQTGLTRRYPARVRSGSSTERLKVSISRLLFSESGRSPAVRNAALASSRLSATPPLGPCDGARLSAACWAEGRAQRNGDELRARCYAATRRRRTMGLEYPVSVSASGIVPAGFIPERRPLC